MTVAVANVSGASVAPLVRRPSHLIPKSTYQRTLERLSDRSVQKHFDPYRDVPWDSPAYQVDPSDERWELCADESLRSTQWYQEQSPALRGHIGLFTAAFHMKRGIFFESVLKRGLLEYASTLPECGPEFRYVYHEVIEEAQHSLMFREFLIRSGMSPEPPSSFIASLAKRTVRLGSSFPALFFINVLAGEAPIDHVQRTLLAHGKALPPLLYRVMRLHVTEEARHISFARSFLRENVPHLSGLARFRIRAHLPTLLRTHVRIMLEPGKHLHQAFGVPLDVIDEAYRESPLHRRAITDSLASMRLLCEELDLITPPWRRVWEGFGLYPAAY